MGSAHHVPDKARKIFHYLKITLPTDTCNRFQSPPLLRGLSFELKYTFVEIPDLISAILRSTMFQSVLGPMQNNTQRLSSSTNQQTPKSYLDERLLNHFTISLWSRTSLQRVFQLIFPKELITPLHNTAAKTNIRLQGVLLHGLAGSSRATFVTTATWHFLQSRRKRVSVVASLFGAGETLDDGCTAHRAIEMPIPVTSGSMYSINDDSQLGQKLFERCLIIW